MKFVRVGTAGTVTPYAIVDERAYALDSLTPDIDGAFLASGAEARVREAIASGALQPTGIPTPESLLAPITRPGSVVCVGMNYAAHAAESNALPPEIPVIFLKPTNTVVGPNDAIEIPRGSDKTDWEVELGIVVGQTASYLSSPEDAAACIAGYVTVNDVSERRFQLEESGGQWSKGKASPTFTPTGPWLVTGSEVDAKPLALRSWVNGEVRQDSSTADMIFDPHFIVFHLSQYMRLDPGDLILTGTPEGVALSGRFPYLVAGDVVEIEIEGLGRQRSEVAA